MVEVAYLDQLLHAVDLLAAAVFAATGALVASRKQMDIFGFMWLAVATGVGGGTVRDVLLGAPVFWVRDPSHVAACLSVAILAHFTAHLVQSRMRLILWLDAVAMSLVAVAGAAKGLEAGAGPLIAIVMGVITASVGGIIRDVLGQEPSIILRREIYVLAALAGACVYVAATMLSAGALAASLAGMAVAFGLRGLAMLRGWALPAYRPRPGRDAPEP